MLAKKVINYPAENYPCKITINDYRFTKLEVSQYYQTKPGRSTVSDEKIQELVKQLDNKEFTRDNEYYSFEPLYIGYRAYNLV